MVSPFCLLQTFLLSLPAWGLVALHSGEYQSKLQIRDEGIRIKEAPREISRQSTLDARDGGWRSAKHPITPRSSNELAKSFSTSSHLVPRANATNSTSNSNSSLSDDPYGPDPGPGPDPDPYDPDEPYDFNWKVDVILGIKFRVSLSLMARWISREC